MARGGTGIRNSWIHRAALGSTLLTFFLSLLIVLWYWKRLPPVVPLWQSRPWGEERLAHPTWIFVLPIGALVLHLINRVAVERVANSHVTFAKILYLTSTLINVLAFIILVQTVGLVV